MMAGIAQLVEHLLTETGGRKFEPSFPLQKQPQIGKGFTALLFYFYCIGITLSIHVEPLERDPDVQGQLSDSALLHE